jgi:O-antigen ligase
MRLEALTVGLKVALGHLPFGVGPGQYDSYDPTRTATQSLLVQTLAEDGILGGFGIVLMIVFVARAGIALVVRSRSPDLERQTLLLACAAATAAFLASGTVAGAPLTVGPMNLWAVILWIELGLLTHAGSVKR